MKAPFRVNAVTLNSGDKFDTAGSDIVVLVGPNNVGKSFGLREIGSRVQSTPQSYEERVVVEDVTINRTLDYRGLDSWIRANRTVKPRADHDAVRSQNTGETRLDGMLNEWRQLSDAGVSAIGNIAPHLIKSLFCDSRLNFEGQAPRQEPGTFPEQLLHWLLGKPGAVDSFSKAFHAAFGYNVIVDAWGPLTRLRISRDLKQEDFTTTTTDGLPDPKVTERLSKLPYIETQSDGVRSFAGILLNLYADPYPLVLIDEPEAFLHPPQARLLGRYLGDLQQDGQLFIATHSLDVLIGLLESKCDKIQVVRLTREQGQTHSRVLSPEQLQQVWKDPLLRFSRVLDGLFHDGVVACEGDTDSQFYSAVTATIPHGGRDVMFTYSGGKQRLALIAQSLRAVGVPVRAVADFDLLNDSATVSKLVAALGGTYGSGSEADRKMLNAAIMGSQADLTTESAIVAINEVLEDPPEDVKELVRKIENVVRPKTGWRAVKSTGLAGVPSGDSTTAAKRLLERLRTANLFVIPVGEVESFVRDVPGHGPAWVLAVIEGEHLNGAESARRFVKDVLESFP